MNKKLLFDALGWGSILWLFGYLLGFILFFLLPTAVIGWIILPIGLTLTLWILFKKINAYGLGYYLILAITWTVIAVLLDYLFMVQLLKPADGYYKLDIYLYYALTFICPLTAGLVKKRQAV